MRLISGLVEKLGIEDNIEISKDNGHYLFTSCQLKKIKREVDIVINREEMIHKLEKECINNGN